MEIENFHEIDIATEKAFPLSVKESVQNIIDKVGYKTYKVYKREISGGGNYLASLFEVDIQGKTPEEQKEINLFIKKSLNQTCNDESESFMSIPEAYAKEQFFYDELKKVFATLEDEAKVPEKYRLRTIKGFTVSSLEAIILENLSKQGYRTLNRMDIFSLKYAELAIKQLATLHGLSFVLKQKNPDYFDKKFGSLSKPYIFNEKWNAFSRNFLDITKSNLDEKWQRKVEAYVPKCLDTISRFYTERSAVYCLCHGDYHKCNILVKTVNGETIDVIPIDYQLMYVGNPLNDFFYFVYMGSDREFREKHLLELKNLYYNTLKNLVQYFDTDVENIYPRETFERDFKERREMGLIIAIIFFPLVFVSEEEVPSFEKHDFAKIKFSVDPRYHKRILEILEEFEELGYL